jgi:hypothetical protein
MQILEIQNNSGLCSKFKKLWISHHSKFCWIWEIWS